MHMFCSAWSIVPPCGCRRRSLIWICWIVLFTVRKSYVKAQLCCLGYRRKVSALYLLYEIYRRVVHPMNQYLNHFAAARNTRASTALGELALVIPRCRTDQFSRSFLPAPVRLWSMLPSRLLSGDTLSSSTSAVKLRLMKA